MNESEKIKIEVCMMCYWRHPSNRYHSCYCCGSPNHMFFFTEKMSFEQVKKQTAWVELQRQGMKLSYREIRKILDEWRLEVLL